jgi:phospholipase/carboxylesterase
VSEEAFRERPPAGEPEGMLVLHHGRGTDELDLLPLADALDPGRGLQVVSVRAPLSLPGSPGYHWYWVRRVGHPDAATFWSSFEELGSLHDELWQRYGIEPSRTLLGGFSMGAVMSYSLGLAAARPSPAGILAFSGFLPTVKDWEPELRTRRQLRVFIAHGRYDPTISVEFARGARRTLEAAGFPVSYHEFEGAHAIDPAHLPAASSWVQETLR